MKLTTILTLLLATATLTSAINASATDVGHTRNQVVTLVVPDDKYEVAHERLGLTYFKVGVAFQVLALLCMGLVVTVTVCARVKKNESSGEPLEGVNLLMAFLDGLTGNADFGKFVFTMLGYIVLDSLFRSTFAGDPLLVYTVNTTYTGMPNGIEPEVYGVIASSAQAALSESCSQFMVHNPECSEGSLMMNPLSLAFCKDDPLVTSQIYFNGMSAHALSFAFVIGCVLSAALNFLDILRLFGGGWIVERLLATLRPRTADGEVVAQAGSKAWSTRRGLTAAFNAVGDVKDHEASDPNEYVIMRIQIVVRMALDGLAYGLMMMVLEVQVDDDCVDMRNMLPVNICSAWAYLIICTCCSVMVMFIVLSAIEVVSKVLNLGFRKKPLMDEPTPTLIFISRCFQLFVLGLVLISLLAYIYSIVLSFFLAYYVPGDSGVVLGCMLTVLSMATQLVQLFDPAKATQQKVDFKTCSFKEDPWGEEDEVDEAVDTVDAQLMDEDYELGDE